MTLMSRLMAGAGVLALSTGFAAAAPATVQNDLNLRSGPGMDYDVIAAMPAGSTVNVMGCEASWCRIAFGGTVGFASRGFLGLGGAVATAPAYGESYGPGVAAPAYDEESYAYGSYGPGYTYGYSGTRAYGPRYGAYEGERRFGNEQRFSEEGAVRGERRVGEDSSVRSERRRVGEEEGAVRNERRVGENTRIRSERRVGEEGAVRTERRVGENNRIRGERSSRARGGAPAQGLNDDANVRSNANATTGAASSGGTSENDHGPNFIGPGKNKVDNH